tara:strand:- start:288 stop:932 length:645 start_codon:yes stop_codon:yes gene_type:complete
MDEDITIINTNTRNEKIKNFFLNNKKKLILLIFLIILILLSLYSYQIYTESQRVQISEKYNNAIIEHNTVEKTKTIFSLKEVVESKDSTYSPLALYFLIDSNLIENKNEVNRLFDILIKNTPLEPEIKNLIIYKKALYNADFVNENELLNIINPIINSESIWKSHALYLAAEYFYSKREKEKSKEFFKKILMVENANQDIIKETQKRLNRDLSD